MKLFLRNVGVKSIIDAIDDVLGWEEKVQKLKTHKADTDENEHCPFVHTTAGVKFNPVIFNRKLG